MTAHLRCVLTSIAIALLCCLAGVQAYAQADTSSLSPDISSLETRFFDHTYPQESTNDRLGRLERMVFGEAKTGSDQARLTALLTSVPAPSPSDATASTAAGQNNASANGQSPSPATNDSASPSNYPASSTNSSFPTAANNYSQNQSSPSQPGDVTASSDYPRITQLESEILGKTFANEPIQQRLEQLEVKAFGKASTSQDLSDRTDALENFADQHYPQQQANYTATADGGYPPQAPPYNQAPNYGQAPSYNQAPAYNQGYAQQQYGGQNYGAPQAATNSNALPPNTTIDQKVTWLEQQVFGKATPGQPLLDRVKRLAANIFPADSPQLTQSLADQVSSMVGAVELNPRNPAVAQAPPQQNTMAPFSQPSEFNPPQYTPTPNPYTAYQQQQQQYTPTYQATQQPQQKSHSHSFMNGLAHVLGTVGSMAAGSMMMGGMGGMGGGYGMGGLPFGL